MTARRLTQNFEVKADPRLTTTPADYAKQLDLALKIRDKLTETHNAIIQIRDVRKQVDDLLKRVAGQPNFKVVNDAGTALNKKLTDSRGDALSDEEPEQPGSFELSDSAQQQTGGAWWCGWQR